MVKIGDLPEGFQFQQKDGLYAEADSEGTVKHVGFYQNGNPVGWQLDLDCKNFTGHTQLIETKENRFPGEPYEKDELDVMQEDFRTFVERYTFLIKRKADDLLSPGTILRCSFCEKSNKEVRKIICGPEVMICNECIELCSDILAEDM